MSRWEFVQIALLGFAVSTALTALIVGAALYFRM
jgi:hypothetical protein